MNPYYVLGVASDADMAALQAAYRKLVRLHHPDLARDDATRRVAGERMVKINWAWHIVSDSTRRAAFDAQLRAQQLEAARRQQEAFRAQTQGQVVRGAQAHMNDVLKAQALRRQQQNQQAARQRAPANPAQESHGAASASAAPANVASANADEKQRLDWQALERARREREAKAGADITRPIRKRSSREEKKRQQLARARLKRIKREDRKRRPAPSARRQLAEAARLFGQEGRAGEAIALCHDVLRVDFRNVPARELLGDFYLRLGREDRALPLWEQALALQPDNPSVRRKLSALRLHDAKADKPRNPRATVRQERTFTRPSPAGNAGFWGRLRNALRGD